MDENEEKPYGIIDGEFDDDEIAVNPQPVPKQQMAAQNTEMSEAQRKLQKLVAHKTSGVDYANSGFVPPSPKQDMVLEQAYEAKERQLQRPARFANATFAGAVEQVERKLGRSINYDEYDKMCRTYASILCEQDSQSTGEPINKQDWDTYYSALIKNEPVSTRYKMRMSRFETQKINEIEYEMERLKKQGMSELKIKKGAPVNMYFAGKVTVSMEDGSTVSFNNGDQVKSYQNEYRKDWIDKRFAGDIMGDVNGIHSDEGFE